MCCSVLKQHSVWQRAETSELKILPECCSVLRQQNVLQCAEAAECVSVC